MDSRIPTVLCVWMAVLSALTSGGQDGTPAPRPSWIESRAPDAFTAGAHDGATSVRATYRADAEVLLPLGFTSIRIASRENVGAGSVTLEDYVSPTGEPLRAYEFVAYSDPERARGLDRTGFFWEVQGAPPLSQAWTAYLGGMTYSPAQRRAEDELSQPPRQYDVIDGLTTAREAIADVYRVPAGGRRTSARDLFADLQPLLRVGTPRRSERLHEPDPLPTPAFLGALDVTLRAVVAHRARLPLRQPFVYGAERRRLDLVAVDRDKDERRDATTDGWLKDPSTVHALRYRTVTVKTNRSASFVVWIEVPPVPAAASAPPALPLAFEYRARAFLRLRFVRTG